MVRLRYFLGLFLAFQAFNAPVYAGVSYTDEYNICDDLVTKFKNIKQSDVPSTFQKHVQSIKPISFRSFARYICNQIDSSVFVELFSKMKDNQLFTVATAVDYSCYDVWNNQTCSDSFKTQFCFFLDQNHEAITSDNVQELIIILLNKNAKTFYTTYASDLYKKWCQECELIFEQHKKGLVDEVQKICFLRPDQQKLLLCALTPFSIMQFSSGYYSLETDQVEKWINQAKKTLKGSSIPTSALLKVMPYLVDTKDKTKEKSKSHTQNLYRNMLHNYPLIGVYSLFLQKNNENAALKLNFLKDDNQTVMDRITQLEEEFDEKGFITFVHGRAWEWNFFNDICCLIEELVYKKQVDSNKVIFRLRNEKTCDVQQLKTWRQELLQEGTCGLVGSGTNQSGIYAEVLFVNYSALSNDNYTNNYFIENNSNAGRGKAFKFVKKMIKEHGLSKIVDDKKLKALRDLHQECNKQTGELVMIAVKANHVDQMMFPAGSGGYLNGNQPASYYINQTRQAVQANLKALDNDSGRFYCLAVPDMPGEYGTVYETRSITAKDTVAYAKYKSAFNAFKKDIASKIK